MDMDVFRKLLPSKRYFFAVLVFLSVLSISLYLSYEHFFRADAVQVTIDPDAAINGTSHLQSGSQTVFIDDQTGYKFFRDARGYCVYRKTTDGGSSWSATSTVDGQLGCIAIQVWYDKWTPGSASSSIHIATLGTTTNDIFYNRLDPGADTLLMGSSPTSTTLTQGGSFVEGANSISITRATNGTIYIAGLDASDSFVVRCLQVCDRAPNWSEAGSNPFLPNANNYALLVPLASGNILAITRVIALEDLGSKVWNNGSGSWDAASTTIDLSATDNTTYDVGMAGTVSSTTPDIVYLAYIASNATLGTDDQIRSARYAAGAWTTTGLVQTGSTTMGITNVGIGIDAANDDVYVAYSGRTTANTAATGRIFWNMSSTTMGSWSRRFGPLDTTPNDFYGVDVNLASDQRIFGTWFHNTNDDIMGETIADISPGLYATSTGTQTPYIQASTTNVYTGGTFVISESYKTNNVTSLTLTETGLIDASTQIENVRLYYESDTSLPYDCVSEAYNGTEPQLGATTTGGFSSANGTTTFDGFSVTVSTTSALCVYPMMDIVALPTTTPTTTLKLAINNPSTDILGTDTEILPTSLRGIASTSLVYLVNMEQAHYHWRQNTATETASYAHTFNEDVPLLDVTQSLPYRLRFGIENNGGTTTTGYQYRIEYAEKSGHCTTSTGWTNVGDAGGAWDMSAVSQLTEAANTTNIAIPIGGVSNANATFLSTNGGQRETTSQTGALTLTNTQYVEFEYSIVASTTAVQGATYCFRVTNAGTPLDTYSVYPEAKINYHSDFRIQRGVSVISGTTLTITAGTDYVGPFASTSAFIRITNTQHSGAGDNANTATQNADDITAYISNASNIQTSVTFTRVGATTNTRVAWEIVEYVGVPGGENEIIVRQQGRVTYGTGNLGVTTTVVSGIATDQDVVVFITALANPDTVVADFNTMLSTATWNSSADTASFLRGETGTDAVNVSYAVVEFTGSNWAVQRTPDHRYSVAGNPEVESITPVNNLSRAFLHVQKRNGNGLSQHEDFGHEVWLSSFGEVTFRLDPGANTVTDQYSVAWVIENTQTAGNPMIVTRVNGTSTGGVGGPVAVNIDIGKTLPTLSIASIFMNNRSSGAVTTYPEPMISTYISSSTQFELWIANTGDTRVYQAEIVEWPTAYRRITQNDYQLFVNNNAILPTDPWPSGATDLGENAEITGRDIPIIDSESIRIRMSLAIDNATMISGIDTFKLQYAPRETECSAVPSDGWYNLGPIGSTTAIWRATSTPVDDGTVLSTEEPVLGDLILSESDVAGTFEEENDTAAVPYRVESGESIEYDWAIENNGAVDKTSYCFRMVEEDGTEFYDYANFPTIRTVGYGAQSQAWRWYEDAQSETPTTSLAATNTAPIDIDYDNAIQLRVTLREVNGAVGLDTKFRLQFSESSSFSTTSDVAEIGDCTNLSYWCYANGGGIDNATITTRTLGDANPCVSEIGDGCGTYNESGTTTSGFKHDIGEASEFAFIIRNSGARTNRTYYFRVYDVTHDEVVPLATSSATYPSLTTKGGSLVFTMEGIASSTIVEGVTVDVNSEAASIAFGTVPLNTMYEAAHRLTLDTNGTQGYQIFMKLVDDLKTSGGATIKAITGTNAVPVAWSTGCLVTAQSCFGYHSGDDTLQGGSTRFSALDTYAGFSTSTLEEVAFSSQPAVNEANDVVFRVFIRDLQDAGQYTTRMQYISVPMF
jgi:hypothetical protein